MNLQLLLAEIRRPVYRMLLLANGLVLMAALLIVVLAVVPLRSDVTALVAERASLGQGVELYRRLASDIADVETMRERLPAWVQKQQWQGSSAEFSRAVLDAGTRSGVVLQKEINGTRQRDGVTVYSKVLNFDADYERVSAFLDEVTELEMLVIPARAVLKPSEDGLAVTLELLAFVGGAQ